MERVHPGYNDQQGWGSLGRIKFPPLLTNPPRAFPGGINAHTEIIVACVCVGPKFPSHYVHRLRAGVAKHLSFPHRFACITDRPHHLGGIGSKIWTLPPERPLPGWYSKINLFSASSFPAGCRVLYFDLDVVITGSLDDLVMCEEPFVMIREFNARPIAAHNSSVMSWVPPYPADCFEMPDDWMERSWGDQECIWTIMGNDRIWDWPEQWVRSYKYHVRPIREVPINCRVVVFHGDPKQDAISDGWVREHWIDLIKEA